MSASCLGPDQGHPQLQRGHPAPRDLEVPVALVLELERGGGAVRDDVVDGAVHQPLHSISRVETSRTGGQHLPAVAPSGISSASSVR